MAIRNLSLDSVAAIALPPVSDECNRISAVGQVDVPFARHGAAVRTPLATAYGGSLRSGICRLCTTKDRAHDVGGGLVVAMAAAGAPFFVVVIALEVGTKSKASSQRLSQLFAEAIEVVLGDCAFTQ